MKRLVVASMVAVLAGSTGAWAAECDTTGYTETGNEATFTSPILSVSTTGSDSCSVTGVSNVLAVTDPTKFVVYKVTSRGFNALDTGDDATYTVDSNGQTKALDLNGDVYDNFTVEQYYAAGLGPTTFTGDFDLDLTGTGSASVDSLDLLVGYTSLGSQEDSLDEIGLQQTSVVTHLDLNAGLLTSSNQPLEGADEYGVIGAIGSYMYGVNGRYNLVDGFSLLGGVSILDFAAPGTTANGVLGAAAIRYVQPGADAVRFFGEAGAQAAGLGLTFTRHYDDGTLTDREVSGSGDGSYGALYGRGGVILAPDANNQIVLSASLKQSVLGLSSYSEEESAANLFAADMSGTSATFTTVKAGADWTTKLASDIDLTASLAVGSTFGSGASAEVFGVGTVTGSPQSAAFAEYGLRLGWDATPDSRLDGFVSGTSGVGIGTHAEIGAGYHMKF